MPLITEGESQGGGSSAYVTGAGSPVGVVTPTANKPVYIDTTNGAIYVASGPTNTDWIVFGFDPNAIGGTAGIEFRASDRSLGVFAGHQDEPLDGSAYFSDAYAFWNGHSDGLQWLGNGTDGEQILQVRTGGGAHVGKLQDKDGNMTVPGKATLGTGPTDALDVSTKGYVDGAIGAAVAPLATTSYVDSAIAAIDPPQGDYGGSTALIADGATGDISWVFGAGTALLNLANPLIPLIVADGTYALSFAVEAGTLSAGGFYNIRFDLERGANNLFHGLVVPVSPATEGCFSVTRKLEAGDKVNLQIDNFDGASARLFTMTQAILVKLF